MARLLVPLAGIAVLLSGCGSSPLGGAMNNHPTGAPSARAAVTTFLRDLEQRNGVAIRQVMTPLAQENESIKGGVLSDAPRLTAYRIRGAQREKPGNNASPPGSIASLRYTVALTPASGFDNDDTDGNFYSILVSETRGGRWLVAEVGGSG